MKGVDKELLKSAKSGDMDAFALLFEPLRPLVKSVAYRIVGSNDADDVTMETFLRAWKAIPRFGGRASLRNWLCRIARNCCIDIVRKRRKKGELPLSQEGSPDWDSVSDEAAPEPGAGIMRAESGQIVRAALGQLAESHRRALLLRYADELSYAEIGAVMGTSIGTVMSRIYYGKKKMYSLLKERS